MNKYQAVIIGFGKAGKTLAVTLATRWQWLSFNGLRTYHPGINTRVTLK